MIELKNLERFQIDRILSSNDSFTERDISVSQFGKELIIDLKKQANFQIVDLSGRIIYLKEDSGIWPKGS